MTTNHRTAVYGLIGKKLGHSFSKTYFTQKFKKENLRGVDYRLFPLEHIDDFKKLILQEEGLDGLNVTIPYKEAIIPFLDELDRTAQSVGAVNTIRFEEGKLIGHNTDVIGFEQSLLPFLEGKNPLRLKAMILGTGGASKAVCYVLNELGIPFIMVSRTKAKGDLTYAEITKELVDAYPLIINTTPLGMSPEVSTCPDIPYDDLNKNNLLYDLVYNPEKTLFLSRGLNNGAKVRNGLSMLELQAEAAWDIWTNY